MTPDQETPQVTEPETAAPSPQRPTKPRPVPVLQGKLPAGPPPASGGRAGRVRLAIPGRGTRGARLRDALVALVLASLVTYYVDFKIRKPGYISINLDVRPATPEGVEDIALEFDPETPSQLRFAIDAPKEVLSRLGNQTLAYDFGLTADDIEKAKREGLVIRHEVNLANVTGLPAHVEPRVQDAYPTPTSIQIIVTPYCEASLSKVELEGSFRVADGLEVAEQRPPDTAVRVKILGLEEPAVAAQGTLRINVAKFKRFVVEVDRDVPLVLLECKLRIAGKDYDVQVLDPDVAVHVVVSAAREMHQLAVPVCVLPPEGMKVDDQPPTVQVLLSLPAHDAEALREQLRESVSEGSSEPLRVVVFVPGRRTGGVQTLQIRNDRDHPLAVPVEIMGLPPGVRFEHFVSEASFTVVPK